MLFANASQYQLSWANRKPIMQADDIAALSAEDIAEFGYGEHLLVFAWRRMDAQGTDAAVMPEEFAQACGEDAGEVFNTFCSFLKALAFAGRRGLTLGAPGCLSITADEKMVLTLIAAAQAEMPALLEAHLRWLAEPEKRHVLELATSALAAALEANGLAFTRPAADLPAGKECKIAVA
jgi:hypothetical protein